MQSFCSSQLGMGATGLATRCVADDTDGNWLTVQMAVEPPTYLLTLDLPFVEL
jgi:hypothetical protein